MRESRQIVNILSIEPAVAGGSIALISSERGTFLRGEGHDCSRAEKILTVIGEVLVEAGLTLPDVDMIAVSTGPGSYSGIRIGISTALGLATALNISCRGVSVLEAIAHSAGSTAPLITAIPVGKNDVAWQAFEIRNDGGRRPAAPPELVRFSTFADKLGHLSGFTVVAHPQVLEGLRQRTSETDRNVDAGTGLAEYVGHFASFCSVEDRVLRPIYLRNSDAAVHKSGF